MEAMTGIVNNIGAFFEGALGWMGDLLTFIGDNPLATIMCVAVPVGGVVFGYLGRLFRT